MLTKHYWFHFLSLVAIVVVHGVRLFAGAVGVLGDLVRSLTSFLRSDTALFSYDLFRGRRPLLPLMFNSPFVKAMEAARSACSTSAATCAAAGIIVGVVTLTGLGLKFSSIVIDYAGGSLLLTALFTSLIVWIVGLAVPVTASYIICAVIAAPALIKLGVAGLRRAHVHLLLRGAVGSLAADRAVAVRGRRDHRRRPVQDDAAVVEVHDARLSGAVHVRARSAGLGLLLMGSFKNLACAPLGRSRWSALPP